MVEILILLLGSYNASANFDPHKLFIKNINLKDGLSQCVVTDIIQDNMGFIWVATFDGLNRFDGTNIKYFRHNPEDTFSIPSSKILRLQADYNNHLYLLTNNGFAIFDCTTGKTIQPFFLKSFTPTWLCKSDADHIWIYDKRKGLVKINTNTFEAKLNKNSLYKNKKGADLQELIEISQKVFAIFTNGDIMEYNPASQENHVYENKNLIGQLNCSGIDKFRNIYFSTDQSDLGYFNLQNKQFEKPTFLSNEMKFIGINDIVYDQYADALILSSYGQGIFVYDYSSNTVSQFKKNEPSLPLSANYPISLFSDSKGIIMIGYDGLGIDIVNPFIKKFIPIKKEDPNDLHALKFVRKIVEGDDGSLFMGTSGSGLVKFNRKTNDFQFYNMQKLLGCEDNFIIELLKNQDELWLGTNGHGIGIFNDKIKLLKTISVGQDKNQLTGGTIWSMLDDKQGSIWVGTRENGLNKVNKSSGTISHFSAEQVPEFEDNGIRCLFLKSTQQILAGTEKGLFQIDLESNQIKKVFPKSKNQKDQSFNSIKCITTDKQQRIWLGTDGSGIVVVDQQYNILKNFNANNVLNNNVIYSLLPQNDTVFWISTNSGLSKIYWNENVFRNNTQIQVNNYEEINGLQSNEFNTGAYLKLVDGNLVFGGVNGINIFKGEDIVDNTILPKVYINEFKVYENNLKGERNIAYLNEVNLQHFENSISISYNTLGFALPLKIKYRYRLVGYDKEWIEAGSRNYISYTNLPSGNYEFQVKACDNNNNWGDSYTNLKIHIATPFFKTWWFITLASLFVLQIAYLIYRYRMKQHKEKEALIIQYNKELAQVEMKALRAQINPHFLFNSLNSINNYILKNDTKQASRYLVKFSQLVRSILNNSSNPLISLQEELQTIELYMLIEGMRFNNQFSYTIEIEEGLNTANIMIPSLLLQPYVENAIWHGLLHKDGEKKIIIAVKKVSTDSVSITIEDNGVGRKMSEEIERKPKHRKSFGMELGASRLRLMNQDSHLQSKVEVIDLVDDRDDALGTRIEITMSAELFEDENITLTQK